MATETQSSMTAGAILDHLCFVSRAYEVLYALGDTSSTVRTLTGSEARCIVGIVQDIEDGNPAGTDLEVEIVERTSFGMRRYIAEGI
jgi:hypothetical protein